MFSSNLGKEVVMKEKKRGWEGRGEVRREEERRATSPSRLKKSHEQIALVNGKWMLGVSKNN